MKLEYKSRIDIFKQHGSGAIVCELGAFKGDFSGEIRLTNPHRLYIVDSFEGTTYSGDKDGLNRVYADLNESYELLKAKYNQDLHVVVMKSLSESFLHSMEDDTFDIVYIDADHSYYSVLKDLEKSRKKVKPGGIISGHDYSPRTQGVINAVNEFVNYYKIPIQLTTDDLLPSYIITNIK